MRKPRPLLRYLILDGALFASALLVGCNTKVGTTATPDAATKTEILTTPPAAAATTPVKPVTAVATKPAAPVVATADVTPPSAPKTAPAMQPAAGNTANGAAAPFQPGISNFIDKNIPVPPGVNVILSGVQISDGPVNETGTSAHFRLQGGVYMSR